MDANVSPEKIERRTRSWPVRVIVRGDAGLSEFAEADKLEASLRGMGHETARVCWGGQWLEVRARRAE